MSFKKFYFLLVLLFAAGCYEKKISGNIQDQEILSDSDKLDRYFQWTDKTEYINGYHYNSNLLRDLEINRDTVKLLNFLVANFDSVKMYDEFPYHPADLVRYTYELEFNGDRLPDIFYEGPSGGEQTVTKIFLNKGDHFELIFTGYQHIIEAHYSGNQMNSFVLINPGCCADPQIVEYYYSLNYADSNITFHLDKTIGYVSETEKPQQVFQTAREFSVKKDSAKLRPECFILDKVEHPLFGENGNVLATYKPGSKGRAMGMKNDNGTEWIYAIMDSVHNVDSQFPTFLEQPTEIRGWILKADIDFK